MKKELGQYYDGERYQNIISEAKKLKKQKEN